MGGGSATSQHTIPLSRKRKRGIAASDSQAPRPKFQARALNAQPSDRLAAADALVELRGRQGRLELKLGAEHIGAQLVLP